MEPIFPFLIILSIVGLSVACTVLYFRARRYRDLFNGVRENYGEVLDRALESEKEYGQLLEEHASLKTTFQQTLSVFQNRQSVAVMTDAQVQLISQTISSLVMSASKDPNKLN